MPRTPPPSNTTTTTGSAGAPARKTTIRVRAGKNGPVFREGEPRSLDENGQEMTTITETVVEVPNTQYYRRRIAKGDLVRVEE
jgi:hypothetical protein